MIILDAKISPRIPAEDMPWVAYFLNLSKSSNFLLLPPSTESSLVAKLVIQFFLRLYLARIYCENSSYTKALRDLLQIKPAVSVAHMVSSVRDEMLDANRS